MRRFVSDSEQRTQRFKLDDRPASRRTMSLDHRLLYGCSIKADLHRPSQTPRPTQRTRRLIGHGDASAKLPLPRHVAASYRASGSVPRLQREIGLCRAQRPGPGPDPAFGAPIFVVRCIPQKLGVNTRWREFLGVQRCPVRPTGSNAIGGD